LDGRLPFVSENREPCRSLPIGNHGLGQEYLDVYIGRDLNPAMRRDVKFQYVVVQVMTGYPVGTEREWGSGRGNRLRL